VDDREVAHDPDVHVMGGEVRDRGRARRLRQESLPVHERSVGVRAQEIVREDLVEPAVRPSFGTDRI